MNAAQWVCEVLAGWAFVSLAASYLVEGHYRRRRPHTIRSGYAGLNWRAMVWVPAYAAWVRRYHDDADHSEKFMGQRLRCPYCGLPHDLAPGSFPAKLCERTRKRIAEENEDGGPDEQHGTSGGPGGAGSVD